MRLFSGVESIAIACGATLVAALTGGLPTASGLGLPLAAAMAGFLAWNWPPAKIFLGDVGSVALGFLLGWLLLSLAAGGEWAAAVLLPLYYLVDASLTLGRRLVRGERVWQPHRQHFYQQGARRLGGHGAVDLRLIGLNCVLTALAVLAAWQPGLSWPALAAGAVLVGLTLRGFAEHAEGASHAA
jgi:UDP-N-acetylmuramyl pentapeptide phosphotransferase/UDP-N-acetylglucosamine-1-phosphate transferase